MASEFANWPLRRRTPWFTDSNCALTNGFPVKLSGIRTTSCPATQYVSRGEMMPRATLRIHLEAGPLAGAGDILQFRTLHVPGEYPTCSNEWRTYDAASAADTSWTCDMEGGATVAYVWKVTRDGETIETVDSLVATRFQETTLHLIW